MKSVLFGAFLLLAGCAKEPSAWTRTDVMIPARDGVRLHTLIFAPQERDRETAVSDRTIPVRLR
jgi:predicted acyl esterase